MLINKLFNIFKRNILGRLIPQRPQAAGPGVQVYDVTAFLADIDLETLDVIRWAPAWMTRAERLLLYSLVFGLRPRCYLEIGTLKGGSALIVSAAMEASGNDGRMVCVEPNPQIDPEHWSRIGSRATLLQGSSPDILSDAYEAAGSPFDFVFINGDHTYAGVLRDANGVLPFVADGAYLLFHDSFFPDVARAIRIYVAQHSDHIVDFGTLTREVTLQPQPQAEPIQWGGLRMMQIRRSLPVV
jgi:predicted O-methyltransferase YrrM